MDILQFNWLIIFKNVQVMGASLVIQLLRLCASNTGDAGLITGQGTKFPHAAWLKKEKNRGKKKLDHGSQGKIIQETKETWQLNAMCNSEPKYFVIWDIIGQDLNEVWGLNGSNLSVLISLIWHFSMV